MQVFLSRQINDYQIITPPISRFAYHSEYFSNPPIPAGLNVYKTIAFVQSTTPAGSNKGIYMIFRALSIFSWFWNPFLEGSDYQTIMSL